MMRNLWRALQNFWEHDPGLSVILALVVLLVFVLPPVTPQGERGPLMDIAFSLLLLAGVAGLSLRPMVRGLLLLVAVAAMVMRWGSSPTEAATALSTLVSLGLMASVVLAHAFQRGPVNVHRIQGAVAAYLLLGLAWASAYELVAALVPGSFSSAQTVAQHSRGWIYFSFVTLTTVGYGDVTPVHPVARSLAMMEALTGQLYPAILLARLVSLQAQPESER
jgi:hypothetical protein